MMRNRVQEYLDKGIITNKEEANLPLYVAFRKLSNLQIDIEYSFYKAAQVVEKSKVHGYHVRIGLYKWFFNQVANQYNLTAEERRTLKEYARNKKSFNTRNTESVQEIRELCS